MKGQYKTEEMSSKAHQYDRLCPIWSAMANSELLLKFNILIDDESVKNQLTKIN